MMLHMYIYIYGIGGKMLFSIIWLSMHRLVYFTYTLCLIGETTAEALE